MIPFLRYYFDPKGEPWWQGNVYGNLVASVVLSAGIIWTFYKMKLKCTNCWRPSHHKVEGTHYRTCHIHSNKPDHKELSKLHASKYPAEHDLLN